MLTMNVGFLAIPGIMLFNLNIGNDPLKSPSQAIFLPSSSQIVSTLSLEASIGSIVIGLLLVRHHRTKQDANHSEAVSEQSHLTCGPM